MHPPGFPTVRMRRLRRTAGLRAMARETRVSPFQFIAPLFVRKGKNVREEISSLPGVYRNSPDTALRAAEELLKLKVPAVILFGIPERKDDEGSEAWDEHAAVQEGVRLLKKELPELVPSPNHPDHLQACYLVNVITIGVIQRIGFGIVKIGVVRNIKIYILADIAGYNNTGIINIIIGDGFLVIDKSW